MGPTTHHHRPMRTYHHVYAHEYGATEWCYSFDTKAEAAAWIRATQQEMAAHPSWYDYSEPWFEIIKGPALEPEIVASDDQLAAAGL